jgi:hypothetical protein
MASRPTNLRLEATMKANEIPKADHKSTFCLSSLSNLSSTGVITAGAGTGASAVNIFRGLSAFTIKGKREGGKKINFFKRRKKNCL